MTHTRKLSLILALALVFSPFFALAQVDDEEEDAPSVATEASEDVPALPQMVIKQGTVGSYLSGQFARQNGDVEGAIRYLRRAWQNDPGNADVASQLQGMLLISGGIDEAVKLATALPADTQKDSLTSLLLCLDAAKRGNLDDAKRILDDAAKVSAGQLWLPLVAAWVEVGRKNLSKPMQIEGLPADANTASALANYHLALINAQARFTDAAVENFKKAVVDANNPPARVMMMMAKFYDENKQPAALRSMVESWRKDNADAQMVTQDITGAFTPQDGIAEVLFTMGNVVQNAGSPQDAIIYLNMARYLKPNFPLVTISLGDAYSDLRQFGKANATYATVDEKSPFYGRAQLRMAMNENQLGRWENALSMLDTLAQKLPAQYEPMVAKGDLLRTHQMFTQATDAYTQALVRIGKPENFHWPIYFARGVCHERQGNWKEAETDLRQALKLRPEQPDVLNYLGYSILMQGDDLDAARTMLEKAASLRPNDPQIADSLGWALYLSAKYEEAVPYLERALEALPSDPTINDHLGDAYWKLGRKTEARFQWERSLSFSPDPDDAAATEKKLRDGIAGGESQAKPPVVAESRPAAAVQ